jgi:hypothetical protein
MSDLSAFSVCSLLINSKEDAMFVIVMHNNDDYIESVKNLAESSGVKSLKIIKEKSIGTKMVGLTGAVTVVQSKSLDKYSQALIANFEGKEKADQFIQAIENDNSIRVNNIDGTAFICKLPFGAIKEVCVSFTMGK